MSGSTQRYRPKTTEASSVETRDQTGPKIYAADVGRVRGAKRGILCQEGTDERGIHSFHQPIVTLTCTHVKGEKPAEGPSERRNSRRGRRAASRGLRPDRHGQERYREFLPTISRRAAATILAGFTCPAMLRAVLAELNFQGLLKEETVEGREPENIAGLGGSSHFAATTVPGVTRSGRSGWRGQRTVATPQADTGFSTVAQTSTEQPDATEEQDITQQEPTADATNAPA